MSATGDQHGFTLLEMLVVLAIAALIAGIGFPRLQSQIAAQEWRTGVAAVTALLRTARAKALRSGQAARIAVTADGTAVRLDDGAALVLPRAVSVAADQPLTVFGDGSASGGEVAVPGSGRTARIAVTPATGLVTARTS